MSANPVVTVCKRFPGVLYSAKTVPCCSITIVTHNDVQKSRPGYVYLRIRAELEYTSLLLSRIDIALRRNVHKRVMQMIAKDTGKERTYVQMECRHTEPSKL